MEAADRQDKREHPIVAARVEGSQVQALVDTGATLNFLSYDVFKFLPPSAQSLVPYTGSIKTADNTTMSGIIGKATVTVTLALDGKEKDVTTEVVVTKRLPYSLILGIRYMKQAHLVVDPKQKRVFYGDQQAADQEKPASTTSAPVDEKHIRFSDELAVLACETITIPARTGRALKTSVAAAKQDVCLLMQPLASLH